MLLIFMILGYEKISLDGFILQPKKKLAGKPRKPFKLNW